ncbi:hypothetical protein B0T18DRAFT_143910 [Schizothecium vesticola]|uniref:Uncharacterized protein n=1 Tax=Schizothecium vesticola TaxID=314040 RepID=A0AA40EV52_9PEZI|nr:hypothetical protein B0T18DRAFT_143910 [Schizothecium vesticola]
MTKPGHWTILLPSGGYGLCPRFGDARNIEERAELRVQKQTARTGLMDSECRSKPCRRAGCQGREWASRQQKSDGRVWGTLTVYVSTQVQKNWGASRVVNAPTKLRRGLWFHSSQHSVPFRSCTAASRTVQPMERPLSWDLPINGASGCDLEDRILLFRECPTNAIVHSPPKGGRVEDCESLALFPESPRHQAPLLLCSSDPNFLGVLRATPPFKREHAVKILRKCCPNLDQHSKCTPECGQNAGKSRHWPILARSSVRPQAPHRTRARESCGSLRTLRLNEEQAKKKSETWAVSLGGRGGRKTASRGGAFRH